MDSPQSSGQQLERLAIAEREGLRLAILCRTLVMGAGLAWLVGSTLATGRSPSMLAIVTLMAFVGIGLFYLSVIGTRHDRWWLKYLISALDILGVSAILVVMPLSATADVPQILAYRSYGIYLLFPLVVLAALSLSWRLVVWSGAVAVAGWWIAFALIVAQMPQTVSRDDIPQGAPAESYVSVVLSPYFIGRGSRVVETGCLLAASLTIALAVYRARAVFLAQVAAEAQRERERHAREHVAAVLGRYVPETIARQLIENEQALAPEERHAVALIADVAGFTTFAAARPPVEVIAALNDFLARAASVVGTRNGVVISYTGDGLLATFNTPIAAATPEIAAVEAARAIVAEAARSGFAVRVGVASGAIVSGSIGSADRKAFTVYGDAVNRASRQEGLAKTLGDAILVDSSVAAVLASEGILETRGPQAVNGYALPIDVFAVRPQAAA